MAAAFGSPQASPELSTAGGDEHILHHCLANALMLNIVTKRNDEMGEGDCQIVLLPVPETEFKEYSLILKGSKKLEIKSKYTIHAGMELSDCRISRHSVTIKMSPEQPPYLNLVFRTSEELHDFRKALSRVTQKLARPVIPVEPEVAEPEVAEVFTPLAALDKSALIVQPEKAAAYFVDQARDVGAWEVHLANKAISTLRQMKEREIVIARIEELASGMMSGDNSKLLTKDVKGVPFFEAKTTRDQRIVWSIEIAPDQDKKLDRQIIKIWGIMTHTEVGRRNWALLSREMVSRGAEHLRRCNARNRNIIRGSQKLNLPESWPWTAAKRDAEITAIKLDHERSEAEFLELHAALSLEKFVPCTKALFETLKSGVDQEMTHVFAMSATEQAIMNHQGSCFVLGRSGTGKTTSMVFRMLGVELSPHLTLKGRRLRSVFVTYSPLLAAKVKEYFQKLFHTLDLQKLSQKQRDQLNEVMGGKGGFPRPPTKSSAFDMTDVGDREDEVDPLPKKFSELQDEHFPLFVSYDRLLSLIEADFDLSYGRTLAELATNEPTEDGERPASYGQLVTYDTFLGAYWEHFNQTLTTGLDPALVFAELIGVIRGSEDAAATAGGFLSKKEYEGLSDRTQGTFANRRASIYGIFEAYRRIKSERNEKDAADRTHAILDCLAKFPHTIPKIDFINVDEAQDNLIIDCKLIRGLCSNPSGFFMCGDTAQTIASGSSFRFDDLKSSFFRYEENEPAVLDGTRRAIQPATFNLTTNYRSHGGICDAADALLSQLKNLFPNTIDNLEPEKGLVHGPKPSFLTKRTETIDQFFSSAEGNAEVEFGAQQCVLVRNEETKFALQQQFGERAGLILLIGEAKGLEFSDVVVYNFFADSPAAEQQWRVVLRDVPGEKAPRLDVTKHSIVGSELKKLYVALTRGRNNVWFWDDSTQVEPVKILLEHADLIQVVDPNTPLPKIGKTSTAEEWKEAAVNLMQQQKYEQAAIAYTRAMMPVEARIATAYGKRVTVRAQKAKLGPNVKTIPQTVVDAFRSIADAFRQAAEDAVHANIDSPGAFPSTALQRLHRNAAELYTEAKESEQAGRAYEKAAMFTEATLAYRKGGLFDTAVRICRTHRDKVDVKTRERILNVAKIAYLKDPATAMKAADLFDDVDKQIEFLKDYGLARGRLGPLLEEHGRFEEAGDVAVEDGEIERAVEMYKRGNFLTKAADTLSSELYAILPFGAYKSSLNATQLSHFRKLNNTAFTVEGKTRSATIKDSKLSAAWQELKVFKESVEDVRQKALLATGEALSNLGSPDAVMFALEKALETPLPIKEGPSRQRLVANQVWYLEFLAQGARIFHTPRILDEVRLQRLFGFRPAEEDNTYTVLPSSFMKVARGSSTEGEVFGAVILQQLLQTSFARVALGKLMAQEARYKSSVLIQPPCLPMTLFSRCDLAEGTCPAYHREASLDDLRQRCQILLNQIRIIAEYTRFSQRLGKPVREIEDIRRFWLEMLANCLYPPTAALGSGRNIDLNSLHEGPAGVAVLRRWLSDSFDRLAPAGGDASVFFKDVQKTTWLIADLFPQDFEQLCGTTLATRHVTSLETASRRSTVHDLLACAKALCLPWTGKMQHAQVFRGLQYFKFVLDQRLPIEISFLLAFVEKIAVALVMSQRWDSKTGSDGVHGVFGPLSLLSHLHTSSDYRVNVLRDQITLLINQLKSLALAIGARPQSLWFQAKSLAPQPFAAAVFLERCLYLQTWCCWMLYDDQPLRNQVIEGFKNLKTQSTYKSHGMHNQYTSAKEWKDIVENAYRTRHRSELDPVLSLQQIGKPSIKLPKTGTIKLVQFKDWEDLGCKVQVWARTPEADIPAVLAKAVSRSTTSNGTSKPNGRLGTPASQTISANGRPLRPSTQAQSTPSTPAAGDTAFDTSEQTTQSSVPPEQLAIAEKLGRRFQARQKRAKEMAALSKTEVARRNRLLDFIPTANKIMEGAATKTAEQRKTDLLYAQMLAGPFSHLFHVLKMCANIGEKGKRDLSKRLLDVGHLELEILQESMDQANTLKKDIIKLASATNPTCPAHTHPSHTTAKLAENARKILTIAKRTIDLFDTNKTKFHKSLAVDLELGEKGCLREKRAKVETANGVAGGGAAKGKKAKKPALGRDDQGYVDDEDPDPEWEPNWEDEVVGGKMPGGLDRAGEAM